MSREQYHLAASLGFIIHTGKSIGLSPHDDYEVHNMLCYEDDEYLLYINPAETLPKDGRIRLHAGTAPEYLSFAKLRPEQREFFETYLPEIAARFKGHVGS